MIIEYPIDKIEQLVIYIENFNNDINEMKEVYNKLSEWVNRGLDINLGIDSLNKQIENWEKTMEILIENFKQNILKLKDLDDRIETDENTQIVENKNMTYIDKWTHFYPIYKQIFSNLEKDMENLTNVNDIISNYENLGIKLGDAKNTISVKINIKIP